MQKRFTEASLLALLSLLMMQSACGVAESPRTRYRPGRIEFDWSSHPSLATDSRRTLEDRLDHDVEILIVKLQDSVDDLSIERWSYTGATTWRVEQTS